jgi:hypothetical protein
MKLVWEDEGVFVGRSPGVFIPSQLQKATTRAYGTNYQ